MTAEICWQQHLVFVRLDSWVNWPHEGFVGTQSQIIWGLVWADYSSRFGCHNIGNQLRQPRLFQKVDSPYSIPYWSPHLLSKGFACFMHLRGSSRLKEVSCSASASGCVAKAVTIECSISMTLPSYLMKLFSTLHKISTSRHVLLHLAKLTALCDVQEILRIDLQVILRLNCVLVFI